MHVPLQYQASEYDCVPTAFINAVSYLFERNEIPPMVIRHIYMYSLDAVGRDARMGIAGTSRHAVRFLGHWLNAYRYRKFSVTTAFLEGKAVRLGGGTPIFNCLEQGGVALCNILLAGRQEHYVMLIRVEGDWVYCFDPYFRSFLRGLRDHVRILKDADGRGPNLKIRRDWMAQEDCRLRFCLGPHEKRECLLIRRNP